MKSRSLMLLLCCLLSISVSAQPPMERLSKEDALTIAQREFEGQDVDYYLMEDTISNAISMYWTVFVDAEPMSGWEHDCFTLRIPIFSNQPLDSIIPTRTKYQLPPAGNYTPLDVTNRYGDNSNAKPVVQLSSANSDKENETNPVAQRTYAVILSGGVRAISNYERYWNDCSFIYQTLVNRYGIPKDNIYPIMSDGTDPGDDMRLVSGSLVSQPLDLDMDGENDIEYAATKSNISSVLSSLTNKLGKDDHLLFYVIDHGGSVDGVNESYINLWGGELLYDHELTSMLKPLSDKYVNINVVLGQCNSGGFIDDLSSIGCVVATASTGSEYSWACSNIPYDEFVYRWTCAVNGATHSGVSVNADADNNGRVTMDEAFAYAKANDSCTETPQYKSTPASIGEDLAFNNLAPSIDLYIKDNPEDTGKEPNTTATEFWKSTSIWIRNENDSVYEHQNPEYTSTHRTAFIYVYVKNRGKEDFCGGGKWLQIHWASASTAIDGDTWNGNETNSNGNATGGVLEVIPIDTIKAGEGKIIGTEWLLPKMMAGAKVGEHHFCLMVKIVDNTYDSGPATEYDMQGSNDQAQKNVMIVRKADLNTDVNVYVRNVYAYAQKYTLELRDRTLKSVMSDEEIIDGDDDNDDSEDSDMVIDINRFPDLTSLQDEVESDLAASVTMKMTSTIYDAWKRGGLKSHNVNLATATNSESDAAVEFMTSESCLEDVALEANEFGIVKLNFNFVNVPINGGTYVYDLVQKDENGVIVGGETFVVEAPSISQFPLNIVSTQIDNSTYELNTADADYVSVRWKNENGSVISDSETVIVAPTVDSNTYTAIATTEDGDVATGSITLDPVYSIESVSLSSNSTELIVELNRDAADGTTVAIVSTLDGATKLSQTVPAGVKAVSFDISTLTSGIYVVTYMQKNQVIDTKKINI